MHKNIFARLLFVAAINLFSFQQVYGQIITIEKISSIPQDADKDSLVLLNITGTLYEPASTLADNKWRLYFAERVNSVISDARLSDQIINETKNKIVNSLPKRVTEESAPQLIAGLQQRQIPVYGITEKCTSTPYAEDFGIITSQHLKRVGIDLEKTLAYANIPEEAADKYSFQHAIIFTCKKPVGPALVAFLYNNHLAPKKIVMVDNSRKSLENAQDALSTTKTEFIGLHYSRPDSNAKAFNPTIGTIEFLAFNEGGEIISDEKAEQIRLEHPEINYESLLDEFIRKKANEHR